MSIGALVVVGAGATVGDRTILYPDVVIGPGAVIGADCVIHARVSLRERVQVGNRVVIQDGAVIGSDGFGFVRQSDGSHFKIPQHADVVIEDDVEIGANTTIDRPAVGETRIRAGAKIDNLVQIAHGVSVGRRVLFAAQVGIAGSTVVDDDVSLAGQVGVAGHLRLGDGVVATAQTGIPNSVDRRHDGVGVSGDPQPRLAEIVRDLPAPAGAQEARGGSRAASCGTRGEAARNADPLAGPAVRPWSRLLLVRPPVLLAQAALERSTHRDRVPAAIRLADDR